MPSDSIAGFLDQAQAVRVLFPEQIEQLIRQPDVPQTDLTEALRVPAFPRRSDALSGRGDSRRTRAGTELRGLPDRR